MASNLTRQEQSAGIQGVKIVFSCSSFCKLIIYIILKSTNLVLYRNKHGSRTGGIADVIHIYVLMGQYIWLVDAVSIVRNQAPCGQ